MNIAQRMLSGILVGLAVASPIGTGVIAIRGNLFIPTIFLAGIAAGLMVLNLSLYRPKMWIERLLLVVVATNLMVTGFDIVYRLFPQPYHEFELAVLWPPMPETRRFLPNQSFDGTIYGGLAAMSGNPEHRVYKEYEFRSDAFGFRNDISNPETVDIIVLGDSFGAGLSTTQSQTWGALLEQEYGYSVYNLSVPGSPWEEFANLALEIERLNVHDNTTLLWMIFTGNDLGAKYLPLFSINEFPQPSAVERWVTTYQSFRYASPVRLNFERFQSAQIESPVVEREFLDGTTMLFYKPYLRQASNTEASIRARSDIGDLEATIEAVSQLANEHGLRLVILLSPSKPEVYEWLLEGLEPWSTSPAASGFSVVMGEMVRERDICYVDLKPYLVEQSRLLYEESGNVLWWPDDTHWGVEGNRLVADYLADNPCLEE